MIRYDYVIRRDESDEIKEYVPDKIPKELPDVVYIEGPNSSGKSTLLNLVALAFFGLKLGQDELNLALRERLEDLTSSEHQKLKFKIEIDNSALSSKLIAAKNSFDTSDIQLKRVTEGKEKPMSYEQFKKEYRLIYDIPNNPLERLRELLGEVKNSQKEKGYLISNLRQFIQNLIKDVKDSKDPIQLEYVRNSLQKYEEERNQLAEDIEKKKKFLLDFKKFCFSKLFHKYKKELGALQEKIKELDNLKTKTTKAVTNRSKKLQELSELLKENRLQLEELYGKATNLLKVLIPRSEHHHLEIWQESSCSDEVKKPEVHKSIRYEASFFMSLLENLKSKEDSEGAEARFISLLLDLVKEFANSNFVVPGTAIKIHEFIKILEKELKEYHGILTKSKNIDDCIRTLDGLLQTINNCIEISNKHKDLLEKQKTTIDELIDDTKFDTSDNLKNNLERTKKKHKYYMLELDKIGVDEAKADELFNMLDNSREFWSYKVYTEDQLLEKSKDLETEIQHLENKLKKNNEIITETSNELKRLERKQPHKYQDYIVNLNNLLSVVQNLEQIISVKFDLCIKKIMERDISSRDLDQTQKEYAEQISEFLANKLQSVRHIDKIYKVKKVDVVEKEIITEGNKIIKFNDLGTGQSQGAYLEGLLSMNDNKKIIVLFDEVAMMDTNTMQRIFNKLRKLYEEKRLVLGIIVQKGDSVDVKPII